MKVYNVRHEMYRSSHFGLGGTSVDQVGTFATLELAKKKLDEIKEQILSSPGMLVSEFADKYDCLFGLSYGHEMGSMSFVPGCYKLTEQEVIGSDNDD